MKRPALLAAILAGAVLAAGAAGERTPMPELIAPDLLDVLAEHLKLDPGQRGVIKGLLDDSTPALRADWNTLRELELKADELRAQLVRNEGEARAGIRRALRDDKQRKRFDRLVRDRAQTRSPGLKNFLFGSGEKKESDNEYDTGKQPGINMDED